MNSETPDTTELIAGIIDVFAESPLSGNPLAVVEGADALSDAQLRGIGGPKERAELFGVDFWSTLEGLREHCRDEAAWRRFGASLARSRHDSIWEQASGFVEW